MGLRKRREKRAAARAQAATEAARRSHELKFAAWEKELADARTFLDVAEEFEGFTKYDSPEEIPIVLKRDERVFLILSGVGLMESKRQRGRYEGGSGGVSIRVAKGVNYRVGAHRGAYMQGEIQRTLVDQGDAVITDQRVVFQGETQTREWAFARLIGVEHDAGLTMLHVSNRQNVSGLVYGEAAMEDVEFRLDLAVARFNGEVDQMVSGLKRRFRELEARRPVPPPAAVPPAPDDGTARLDRS